MTGKEARLFRVIVVKLMLFGLYLIAVNSGGRNDNTKPAIPASQEEFDEQYFNNSDPIKIIKQLSTLLLLRCSLIT
jgi:hypothetical protein